MNSSCEGARVGESRAPIFTWNGIAIKVGPVYPRRLRGCDHVATLGDFDIGVPYAFGETPEIAAANLIQGLWESA